MSDRVGVVLISTIETYKTAWGVQLQNNRTRVEELKKEIERLEIDCIALDGALQAVNQIMSAPSEAIIPDKSDIDGEKKPGDDTTEIVFAS